jgi:F-type H+-transporting ATPase subunit b
MMHGYAHFWLDPKFWVAVSFVLFFVLFGRKVVRRSDGRARQAR